VIASVYIGFAVADGRSMVNAVECGVAMAFVVVAAAGVTGPAWLPHWGSQPTESRTLGSNAANMYPDPVVASILRRRGLGRRFGHRD
jgi:hypothetical protein